MTYSSWATDHLKSRQAIQQKLEAKGLTPEQVVDYFNYDIMSVNKPNFCPLYAQGKKCHNVSYLNCYLCACPHFKYSDDSLYQKDSKKIFSECTINSRFATDFEFENDVHCNCADCTIPHTKKAALKAYEHLPKVNDTCSILEFIRSFQLSDILGRYKLF